MSSPLRIVTMNAFLPGYTLVAEWAERHGHEIVLVVTPPVGASDRYDEQATTPFVQELPKSASVLITGKLRSVAAPVIASLAPDLLISAAFPRLIPPDILGIPKYGAVNLHPSALPSGRGPNPARLIYEGASTIGATLHRTEAEFDTGAILSQRERPLPDDLSGPAIFDVWMEMLREVLEEGAARALAGEPGVPQDPARASEAAAFTEEEQVLDLSEPFDVLRRRVAAVNFIVPRTRVRLNGALRTVRHVDLVPPEDQQARSAPGTVLAEHPDGWTVQAGDGAIRLYI